MFDWLDRRLALSELANPTFPRGLQITRVVLIISIMADAMIAIVDLVTGAYPAAAMTLLVLAILLFAYWFLHQKRVIVANIIYVFGMGIVLTLASVYIGGGLRSASYPLFVMLVIYAGITISKQAALITMLCTILIGVGLVLLENSGLLPSVNAIVLNPVRLATYSGSLIVITTLLYIAIGGLNQALARLHQNEASQAETNRRLQEEIEARTAREREQAAVLTMASAMRTAPDRTTIVPVILTKLIELFHAQGVALVVPTPNSSEQRVEQGQGLWQAWSGEVAPNYAEWHKITLGNSTAFVQPDDLSERSLPDSVTGVAYAVAMALEPSGGLIGSIWLGGALPFDPQDLRILAAIGEMVGNALQRIEQHAETQRRAEQLAAVNRLGHIIAETLELPQIYERLSHTTHELLPNVAALYVQLYDAEQNTLTPAYGILHGQPVNLHGLLPLALRERPDWTTDLFTFTRALVRQGGAQMIPVLAGSKASDDQGVLYIPMVARGKLTGIIQLESRTATHFGKMDSEFLTLLANTAATFIQNAILFDDLQASNLRAQQELAERKLAEATIRRHLSAMETSMDGIVLIDEHGNYAYLNQAYAALYGYQDASQLLGKPWFAQYGLEEQARIVNEIRYATEHEGRWRGETIGLRTDGTTFQQEVSVVLIGNDEVTGVVRDITERKNAEEALRRSQRLESLGVLAGGIAHDFNNLLVGVLGQSSLAKAKLPLESPALGNIEKAMTAASRAADLTRQLLAYAGKGKFQVEQIDLKELILDNQSLFETAVPKHVELLFDLPSHLPLVEGDIGQIQQVVMNLIMNAAEATATLAESENGQVVVQADDRWLEEMPVDGDFVGSKPPTTGHYIYLTVQDNGVGMDKAMTERIFDPFFSTKGSGRGLGLSATLGIIQLHKGALRVESKPGKGTTFCILLPVSATQTSSPFIEPVSTAIPLTGIVLVVDDEPAVREVMCEILEMSGLQVLSAPNGRAGLEIVQAKNVEIAVAIVDMQMPEMNGLETLERMLMISPNLQVILSSGYSEYELADHLIGKPNVTFLQKPYSIDTVVKKVQERMQLRRIETTIA